MHFSEIRPSEGNANEVDTKKHGKPLQAFTKQFLYQFHIPINIRAKKTCFLTPIPIQNKSSIHPVNSNMFQFVGNTDWIWSTKKAEKWILKIQYGMKNDGIVRSPLFVDSILHLGSLIHFTI